MKIPKNAIIVSLTGHKDGINTYRVSAEIKYEYMITEKFKESLGNDATKEFLKDEFIKSLNAFLYDCGSCSVEYEEEQK
jgi:hypothetical protein